MYKDIIKNIINARKKWKSQKWGDLNKVYPYSDEIIYYIPATLEVTEFLNKNYTNRNNITIPDFFMINNYTIYDDLTYKESFNHEFLYTNIKKISLNDLKRDLRNKKIHNILEENLSKKNKLKIEYKK